jgi:Kef-type K+ transport system membrane component KefB/voltage-gated potassium channel Kch
MNPDIFLELSLILIIATLVSGIARLLKQPAIIGYIISGIIAGPVLLNFIDSTETFSTFSHIGVALLLFFVGINLNPDVIKQVGKISIITGVGQVVFTAGIGFLISWVLGFSTVSSLYISIALAFSSTIIIMKLLSDKKDLETLYGRIAVGFLIVQDLIAIIILLVISSSSEGQGFAALALETLLKGAGSIILLLILTKKTLPKVTELVAKSQEALLLFSLTWCFAVASGFHYLGFSIEAGALLAGISLSYSPYHFEISSKLKPLRDFFLVLFFIMLGSQMVFANIIENFVEIAVFSLFVLFGNPLIVMTLMGIFGYTRRTSFMAGLTVAQISEFSLIVIAMGISVGHLSQDVLSVVTTVGLITFAGSTYMIKFSNTIYPKLSHFLKIFERKGRKVDSHYHRKHDKHDIILFGYNRIGFDIMESLSRIKKKFLIVDYDPDVIKDLSQKGYDCKYGDANDMELLEEIDFTHAKMVISTIPIIDTNLLIIHRVAEENTNPIIAVVSHQIDEATRLYEEGATYVIMPHFLGGKHFSTMIENNKLSIRKFLQEKIEHLEHIKRRKDQGHEHPTHL